MVSRYPPAPVQSPESRVQVPVPRRSGMGKESGPGPAPQPPVPGNTDVSHIDRTITGSARLSSGHISRRTAPIPTGRGVGDNTAAVSPLCSVVRRTKGHFSTSDVFPWAITRNTEGRHQGFASPTGAPGVSGPPNYTLRTGGAFPSAEPVLGSLSCLTGTPCACVPLRHVAHLPLSLGLNKPGSNPLPRPRPGPFTENRLFKVLDLCHIRYGADPSLPEQEALLIRADSYRSISSSRARRLWRVGDYTERRRDRPICGVFVATGLSETL
ncbi:unnamed protein product [Gadus morhua 'NCC']